MQQQPIRAFQTRTQKTCIPIVTQRFTLPRNLLQGFLALGRSISAGNNSPVLPISHSGSFLVVRGKSRSNFSRKTACLEGTNPISTTQLLSLTTQWCKNG